MKVFGEMFRHVNQQQNQAPGRYQGVSQHRNAQQVNQNMPALNATNLQQLQQQEEALQRARRASSQTATSGASAIPPAPFGAPSPQGVPHAYGPGSIPPQELKLPPPKKRKQSHPTATPVAAPGGSKAPTHKQAPAEVKPIIGRFKCSVPECQYHYQGFATQNDLNKHVEDNHKAEEPIEDALEFALQSFSTLVKDESKTESQGSTKGLTFAIDLPSTNKAKSDVKTEGPTPAPGTTPMGRVSSQSATKPGSPASNQQLTVNRGLAKISAPSLAKSAPNQDGMKERKKASEQDTSTNAWAGSAVSLEAIRDGFMDLHHDRTLGFGPMDEFLNTEMFDDTQDTPDSVETGIATQTPKDNEPMRDGPYGKDSGAMEGSWIPADWYCLPGRFEEDIVMNDTYEDIDWEMVDLKNGAVGVDDNGLSIYSM